MCHQQKIGWNILTLLILIVYLSLACNPLVEHPLVLALLDRVLMRNYLLSQLQAINILPGEVRQPLHHDDGFYPFPRPRAAFSAATIWAIDDFNEENGATLLIPKSHSWGDRSPGDIDTSELIPAVMPAGSVVFFLGTLWHCAGPNHSDEPRMAATAQYCEPWARHQSQGATGLFHGEPALVYHPGSGALES